MVTVNMNISFVGENLLKSKIKMKWVYMHLLLGYNEHENIFVLNFRECLS